MRLLILILIWQTKDWVKNNTMIKLTDLLEAEKAFTATSKETGNVSVFKTKAARDAAVKAGSHEKRKTDKDDAVDVPTGEKKPNMFSKDAGYDAPDAKSDEPNDEPKSDNKLSLSKRGIGFDMTAANTLEDELGGGISDLTDDGVITFSFGENDKETSLYFGKEDDRFVVSVENPYGDDFGDLEYFDNEADAIAHAKELANKYSRELGGSEPKKDEPVKDSTGDRTGNSEVNKVVRNTAKKLGITPAKLGKDEYKLKMSQAAVEALTDANFHSEARALIAKLEGKPEWAEKPTDMPDISSPEYDEWRKNSVYSSKYYDADDSVMDLGTTASQEAGWDGRDALDSIAFDLKMNGFKNLAATLQSVIDDEKNEGTIKLTDLLKEAKFKKEERDLKNLVGTVKIDFEEALEMLEEDGVLEAMEHLENAIERIQYVHKQLKRKS
jgi:hypothetical protein